MSRYNKIILRVRREMELMAREEEGKGGHGGEGREGLGKKEVMEGSPA